MSLIKSNLITQPEPSFSSADRDKLLEILQRSRRIETRLTRLLETEGIATGIQRPWFVEGGLVMIPSPTTTIDAIIQCIPNNWRGAVNVMLKDETRLLCRVILP